MRDKTHNLFAELEDLAYNLQDTAQACVSDYSEAKCDFERLGRKDEFDGGYDGKFLTKDFDYAVRSASETLADVHYELSEFDKALAKLIQIRGQLAEEAGVPMFSHLTGGKQWERYDHEYMM